MKKIALGACVLLLVLLSCPDGNIRTFLNDFRPYAEGAYDIPGIKINPEDRNFSFSCLEILQDYWMTVYNPDGSQLIRTTLPKGTVYVEGRVFLENYPLVNFSTYRIVFEPKFPGTTLTGRPVELSVTPGVIYADPTRTTDGGGSCWADARNDIQGAITAANTITGTPGWTVGTMAEVRICQGTFAPPDGGSINYNSHFEPRSNVKIIGGYNKSTNQVEPSNRTVLTGYHSAGNYSSYRVFYSATNTTNWEMHNISITKGYADDLGGGGMYLSGCANVLFKNCKFENNYAIYEGGAAQFASIAGSVRFEDCSFTSNSVAGSGGCVSASFADPYPFVFSNCVFEKNWCSVKGGALYFPDSVGQITIEKCIFENNGRNGAGTVLTDNGGAVSLGQYNSLIIKQSVFSLNAATENGGAICLETDNGDGETLVLDQCVFFNNSVLAGGNGMSVSHAPPSIDTEAPLEFVFCTFVSYGQSVNVPLIAVGPGGGEHLLIGSVFYNSTSGVSFVSDELEGLNYYARCLSNLDFSSTIEFPGNVPNKNDNRYQAGLNIFRNLSVPKGPDGDWGTADDGLQLSSTLPANTLDMITGIVIFKPTPPNSFPIDLTSYPEDVTGRARSNDSNGNSVTGWEPGAYEYYP